MVVDNQFPRALYKAMIASGYDIPVPGQKDAAGALVGHGALLTSLADHNKEEGAPIVKGFADMGYKIYATDGTAAVLRRHGVECEVVRKIRDTQPNLMTLLTGPEVDFLINTPERERTTEKDGLLILAAPPFEHGVAPPYQSRYRCRAPHRAFVPTTTARCRRPRGGRIQNPRATGLSNTRKGPRLVRRVAPLLHKALG